MWGTKQSQEPFKSHQVNGHITITLQLPYINDQRLATVCTHGAILLLVEHLSTF